MSAPDWPAIANGLDAGRRAGWARFYAAQKEADSVGQSLNDFIEFVVATCNDAISTSSVEVLRDCLLNGVFNAEVGRRLTDARFLPCAICSGSDVGDPTNVLSRKDWYVDDDNRALPKRPGTDPDFVVRGFSRGAIVAHLACILRSARSAQ